MRKYLFILIFSFVVLPMTSQTKKTVPQSKRTNVTQPKKTIFQFEMKWDASFKKEGENNFNKPKIEPLKFIKQKNVYVYNYIKNLILEYNIFLCLIELIRNID